MAVVAPLLSYPEDVASAGVHVFFCPRTYGLSNAMASLLVHAQQCTSHALATAVVLTSRSEDVYLNAGIPAGLIFSGFRRSFKDTLVKLITMQRGRKQTLAPGKVLPAIALVADDIDLKVLPGELKDAIQRASEFNIMIVLGTCDITMIPKSLETIATHVFSGRCITTKEPKAVFASMFKMYNKADEVGEALAALSKYEFLAGIIRPPRGTPHARCPAPPTDETGRIRMYIGKYFPPKDPSPASAAHTGGAGTGVLGEDDGGGKEGFGSAPGIPDPAHTTAFKFVSNEAVESLVLGVLGE